MGFNLAAGERPVVVGDPAHRAGERTAATGHRPDAEVGIARQVAGGLPCRAALAERQDGVDVDATLPGGGVPRCDEVVPVTVDQVGAGEVTGVDRRPRPGGVVPVKRDVGDGGLDGRLVDPGVPVVGREPPQGVVLVPHAGVAHPQLQRERRAGLQPVVGVGDPHAPVGAVEQRARRTVRGGLGGGGDPAEVVAVPAVDELGGGGGAGLLVQRPVGGRGVGQDQLAVGIDLGFGGPQRGRAEHRRDDRGRADAEAQDVGEVHGSTIR